MRLPEPPPWLSRHLAGAPEPGECILCRSKRCYALGVFEPREPWRYCPLPPAPGKVRLLLYSLCRRCFRRPDKAEAVEAELLRRMGERP